VYLLMARDRNAEAKSATQGSEGAPSTSTA
jgi:hypothetical protein